MEALRVEIINPMVKDILQRLADLHLITIYKEEKSLTEMKDLIKRVRSKTGDLLTVEEVNSEVEYVRTKRYAKKKA
jgi:hypothetical protein